MIKPRIRSIKPETVTDHKLAQVSRDARLTFIYLWTQSDDDGLQFGVMRTLTGKLFPHDHDVTPELLGAWLVELATFGLIEWLKTKDGVPVIRISGWHKHQRVDKPGKSLLLPMLQESTTDIRESVAPLIFDLRPPTFDHRPTTMPDSTHRKAEMSVGFYQAKIVEAWNTGAAVRGYAKVIALKGRRLSALRARLDENGWYANALAAIEYLNADAWYSANPGAVRFDTLIQPGKVEYYIEKSGVKRNGHAPTSRGGARDDVDRGIHEQLENGGGRITENSHE